jgi:hypothetical protein
VALCAAIAPDDATSRVREVIEAVGGDLLVHVATPVEADHIISTLTARGYLATGESRSEVSV